KDNNITNNTFDIDGEDDPDAHSYGIRFVNTTNSIIIGNDITTQTTCDYCHGIYLTSNSHNNTIENNSIYTAGNYARGIYSHTSNNQTIYNNTIDVNDISGNPVYLYQSNNCVINYTTIDSSGDARGIRLDLSDNNVIDNADITTTSLNAIYFYDGSENNNITNTNITSTSYQTIHMSTGCHGSYIDNVTAQCSYRCLYTATNVNNWEVHNSNFTHTSSSNELAYLDGDNWLINNTIMTTTGSTNGEGVEIRTNCDNAQILNSKIKTYGSGTASDALNCLCYSPDSMSVKDTTIESVNDNDVYFNQGTATYNFTNVTFTDKAWGGSATAVLNVHWYLDVYVNETDGSIIEGADVEGNDTNGDQWFSEQTQASGKIPQQALLEYWEDDSTSTYYTNYTVNASKSGYSENSTEVNLTTNKVVYLTLGQPPNISGETREPDPTYHSDNATLNATITDADGDLETVWISGNWSGSWVNYTGGITNVGDVYSYKLLSGNLSYQEVVGWRYYANDTSGNVGQGNLQVFTVQNHVPTNVTLEEPPNGTITADNTTFFDWSNATDDDGDSITYTLQVDNDTDFLSLEVEKTGLTNSDYTLTDPEALEEDVYYWRVYSNDSYETNLSDTWQFEINPTQAVGVSMSNKLSEGVNWTISIVPITNESAGGNNGSGITEYHVEVSAEGTNVDLYIKADDDLKTSGGDVLGLGNETYSYNQTNNTVPSDLKFQLTLQYADNQIGDNLPNGTKVYLKFFLSAPASQPAGTYNNTVMVKAVPYGYSP
ncbi:MAG: right-handed parallel beta-helix repeat-containing protein, partial [Candidatus Aenigmatarchaeota archaeon]